MGANESRPGAENGSRNQQNQSKPENLNPNQTTEDLYEILQIPVEATSEEIKKAFRKQALIHHPDKNHDNVEVATKRFAKIQQAYEVLSDEDERAFYDRHREDLLNGVNDDFENFDPTNFKFTKPSSSRSSSPGLSTKHILKFFDSSLWKGNFDDSETSFFSIYRSLFNQISSEEMIARQDSTIVYPSFGNSQSAYDQDIAGERALKYFYSTWSNFATQKTFEWIEPHHASSQADRRYKRLVEKENQRVRDAARREYNETIRSLVGFVKKRDPRFARSTASNPEKWRAQEIQRIKRELREVAEKRAKEREEEAKQFREQEWQMQQGASTDLSSDNDTLQERNKSDEGSDDEEEEEEEEEIVNDWYCAACGKDFNSQGAWDNHERSKKHKQNCSRLRKQLLEEETEFVASKTASPTSQASPSLSETLRAELSNKLTLDDADKSQPNTKAPNDTSPVAQISELEEAKPIPQAPDEPFSPLPQHHDLPLIPPLSDTPQDTQTESDHADPQTIPEMAISDEESEMAGIARRRGKKARRALARNMMVEDPLLEGVVDDKGFVSIIGDDPISTPSSQADNSEVKPEMSKREKRRAKEVAKKQNAITSETGPKSESCNHCQMSFASKTKLFEHIKQTGHATASKINNQSPNVRNTKLNSKRRKE
ncbi:uncharacterized protein MELLADRAFT_117657 [Melampsora larici-populina 98AG31]|uniref:J domain-containing protein n=1 Tax=Melampsora larici-populina (strain 98AG31 / pathotype 3-4-7) TaxID=747676 RepID=F4S031_MELLP|nr:uncharacterized protein MELLADRAFT_117657 [Melampsora larici-populina 98AG31]EGG01894.1 hypothetical protein MELLADRAFT_117657 [Melampsora larici-populina 98AG31]